MQEMKFALLCQLLKWGLQVKGLFLGQVLVNHEKYTSEIPQLMR